MTTEGVGTRGLASGAVCGWAGEPLPRRKRKVRPRGLERRAPVFPESLVYSSWAMSEKGKGFVLCVRGGPLDVAKVTSLFKRCAQEAKLY